MRNFVRLIGDSFNEGVQQRLEERKRAKRGPPSSERTSRFDTKESQMSEDRNRRKEQIMRATRDEMREYLHELNVLTFSHSDRNKPELAEEVLEAENSGKPRIEDWLSGSNASTEGEPDVSDSTTSEPTLLTDEQMNQIADRMGAQISAELVREHDELLDRLDRFEQRISQLEGQTASPPPVKPFPATPTTQPTTSAKPKKAQLQIDFETFSNMELEKARQAAKDAGWSISREPKIGDKEVPTMHVIRAFEDPNSPGSLVLVVSRGKTNFITGMLDDEV